MKTLPSHGARQTKFRKGTLFPSHYYVNLTLKGWSVLKDNSVSKIDQWELAGLVDENTCCNVAANKAVSDLTIATKRIVWFLKYFQD